eukprot:TRINITY_DN6539_c0_g1_i1.p1 TRINITY_DN6539_c0_g1~~TRINITY_DN6539_c0_g1_i1.p1  ORF type:complete len:115 (+),score=7.00 TRINITY_DN6539_c0_g1_i1:634-978(+)
MLEPKGDACEYCETSCGKLVAGPLLQNGANNSCHMIYPPLNFKHEWVDISVRHHFLLPTPLFLVNSHMEFTNAALCLKRSITAIIHLLQNLARLSELLLSCLRFHVQTENHRQL